MTEVEKLEVIYKTIEAMVGTDWQNSPLGILTPKDKVWRVLDRMTDRLNETMSVPIALVYFAEGVAIRPKLDDAKKILEEKHGCQ